MSFRHEWRKGPYAGGNKLLIVPRPKVSTSNLWTPASGALWLDMFNTANYTDVGGFASQVNDLTGNGRNAIEATNRPTITTASGYTVLRFDGVNDQMTIGSQFFPSGAAASASYIIAMVAKINNNALFGGITTHPAGTVTGCALATNGGGRWSHVCAGSTFTPTVTYTTRTILAAVLDAGVLRLFVNGTQAGTSLTATGNIVNASTVKLGTYRVDNATFGAFDLEELSVFTGTATTTIRQNLEGYFANKRGLTGGLPAGHPWKSTPPTN